MKSQTRTTITMLMATMMLLIMALTAHGQTIDAGQNMAATIGTTVAGDETPAIEEAPAAPEAAEAPAEPDKPTLVELVEEDPLGEAAEVVKAIKGGNWRMVAAGLLAFLMMALGKIRGKVKWFDGDRGGAVLVGILGFGGALSTALASGVALDFQLLIGTFGVVFTAVGGYTWIKRLIWPQDKPSEEMIGGS